MTSSLSLSTFSSDLGCQVLNPDAFKKPEVINAFHPDYVKTYHPDLMDAFRTFSKNKQRSNSLTNHVEKMRETVPSHGTVFGVSETSVSVEPKKMMKRPKLERTEFHIYQKAKAKK